LRSLDLRTPSGTTLSCSLADGFASRFVGLMGRSGLPAAQGMLFVPGGSIHTFFMRFAIDAAFLDADGTALRVAERVRPWRVARAPRGTKLVLELAGGEAASCGLVEGARLEPVDGGWAALVRRR
jgi:hypothetical protein